ncbi:streptophobe family protein [Streptomyces sp. NBC_01351]|uniref:streptophobe family protein n=1 Tax=Streptomyces sp. NBC_01351 TaxID=2903833 RepID=UPI002E372A21|nr:streptophobe family protein [Streptomyces sp. NBC_01351]
MSLPARRTLRVRWGDVLLSGVAAVGWSLIVMAAVAGAGLHLLGADAHGGSLGAMTAAVVVLAVGGTVTPSGDMSVFGVDGPGTEGSLDVMPLGVALAGALVLASVFLRSVRAGAAAGELAARVTAVAGLFVATAGGLAWAGHDVVTLDGSRLPGVPAPAEVPPKLEIPGIGDIGGLLPDLPVLPDRVGELIEARARVGFSVELGPTLVGAGVWVAAVLGLALLVSRRGPAGLARYRPAASAVVAMLLVAVAAGLAAAVWAAVRAEPGQGRQVVGAALLGAPNGAWLGVLLGLFVPLSGRATGAPARLLPDPLDELLVGAGARDPVTVARLAEYDGRVWLLVAGAALLLLYAGVLAAVRSPGRGIGQCAGRLAVGAGVASAVLVGLTGFSADASLAVLGVDAVSAGAELRGSVPFALALGAGWGAAAGAAGAALTRHRRRPADPASPGPAWPDPAAPTAAYGPGADPDPAGARRSTDPDARTAPHGQGSAPYRQGLPPDPDPAPGADGSWDVTVTGIPPRAPKPAKPPLRPPFTPPPPPGAPPPPRPSTPP